MSLERKLAAIQDPAEPVEEEEIAPMADVEKALQEQPMTLEQALGQMEVASTEAFREIYLVSQYALLTPGHKKRLKRAEASLTVGLRAVNRAREISAAPVSAETPPVEKPRRARATKKQLQEVGA